MDGSFHSQCEALATDDDPALGIIGSSPAIQDLRATVLRFAPLPAPVLITGETGTGKELVARALHSLSRRRGRFVALNAAALPATLVATELFGHERGAFTGATRRHLGAFEQASGGTLMLDEVADLPLDLQAWLLRVLEAGEVTRLGGERSVRIDVRIVVATNADLADAVRTRRFRADLYWRLAVLPIRVPPLRDRREDIPAVAEHLLAGLPNSSDVGTAALQILALHHWPGNVRELRSVLLRAVASADGSTLGADHIVAAIGPALMGQVSEPDARAVASVLLAAGGNIAAAARRLGLPRSTLRDRLRSADRIN